jgi:nucleotide-binding universal stress UspA family protein
VATKPIVVGTDGSEPSLRTVDWATREAVLHDVPLRVVSVWAIEPRINLASADSPLGPVTLAVLEHAHGPVAMVPDSRAAG